MMSFAVFLLCTVSGLTLGSTSNPLQEMNTEDVVLSLSQQMSNMEERIIKNKNEITSKLEQVFARMSEIEKSCNAAIDGVSDKLQVEKDKLVEMDDHVLVEVFELRKKAFKFLKNVSNVENEVSRDRARTDLLQVRLNETANMTHASLASRTQIQQTMQKNIEKLENGQSNLSDTLGNAEKSLDMFSKDLSNVSDRLDTTFKLTVQNNTNDIKEMYEELSRIQTLCNPPCENGGQCVKNVCNCTTLFTGDRCHQVVCIPPCENGGRCMENNVCICTHSFTGDRCQDYQCGVIFNNTDKGGAIIRNHVVPWIALYGWSNLFVFSEQDCTGSVIHRHFVLTSAYCGTKPGSEGFLVILGLHDLKNGSRLQKFQVRSIHVHPQFKRSPYDNYDYNVALLELEEPLPFGLFDNPVCLPPREISQDETFYKPNSTANALHLFSYLRFPTAAFPIMVYFTIRPLDECRRKLKEMDFEMYYPSPDLSFCVESSVGLYCLHYGSPLMQASLAEDGTLTWTQVGLTSYSPDCIFYFSLRLDHTKAWMEATIAAYPEQ